MTETARPFDPWRAATWEGAEAATLAAGAALTLPERLLWLERTAAMARQQIAGTTPAASGSMTLLELLHQFGGAVLAGRFTDGALVAALLRLAGGRQILVVERTCREGIRVLLDPTAAEIEAARELRLWELWNSERARPLAGAI